MRSRSSLRGAWLAALATSLGLMGCSSSSSSTQRDAAANGGSGGSANPDAGGGASGSGGAAGDASTRDAAAGDASTPAADDWPTYQHDVERSGTSPHETALSISSIAGLKQHWAFATGSTIEASASVVGGTVYIGSWNGNEYALSAASGSVLWKTNLGTAVIQGGCNSPYSSTMGVTASAAIAGGVVYTAGGDNKFHALDAKTGAALWSVSTIPAGDAQTDHTAFYPFASPLVVGGDAYYGVSSGGNCPSVQGAVLAIDLASHQLVDTFFTVPSGYVGGSIWGSPTIDPATKTLYVDTGECNGTPSDSSAACPAGSYTDAILALDVTTPGTLKFKGAFLLPAGEQAGDYDFGSTPTLFQDASGRKLVGSACKDGYFYAADAGTLKLVWSEQLTPTSGNDPITGEGSISPAAFAAGALFVAVGDGANAGRVLSLDPATGKPNWTTQLSAGVVMGPVVYANELVYVGTGTTSGGGSPTVQILNAKTGAIVKSVTGLGSSSSLPNFVSDSVTVSAGQIFFGTGAGKVYAYGL